MTKTVIFAAGGSGGHLIPAQVVARELQLSDHTIRTQFLGTGLSNCRFFDSNKFDHVDIPSGALSWHHPVQSLRHGINILRGIWLSYQFFTQRKPNLVVGFGSYHSFPVIAAAYLKKIPFVLLESNVYPGQVNRLFSRRSKAVMVPYTECRKYLKDPVVQVKMPLRQYRDESTQARLRAAEYLGLDSGKLTLVVLGGSQGARFINQLAQEAVEMLADRGYQFQLIHLCGKASEVRNLEAHYSRHKVAAVVKEFEPLIHHVWALADLAICRMGAMTLAELIEFEVPAIVIPYPQAKEGHQDKNANFFVEQVAGGIKVKEELASAEKMLSILLDLLSPSGNLLKEYRKHLREFKLSMPTKPVSSYIMECL